METKQTERSMRLKAAIESHLADRIARGIERYPGDDRASVERRQQIRDGLDFQGLVQSAREFEGQIQIASHIAKGIHPDIKVKKATNLLVNPANMAAHVYVGSRVLDADTPGDATGNGSYVKKAYELNRLLTLEFEGQRIYAWLKQEDTDTVYVFTAGLADKGTVQALISLGEPRCAGVSSSQLAKQIYWLLDEDEVSAHDDGAYHLLAPLYPTSLIHRVYQQLQDDRFSDEAKAARAARKEGTHHARPVREYSDLAIQKLGGTKPQNISQLNSERRGDNCLLASVPPVWKSAAVRPLLGVSSLFKVWGRRPSVSQQARALRRFLEGKPPANLETRERVRAWVEALVDELIQFQAELLTLEPGWSQSEDCDLPMAQRIWLDPEGQPSSNPLEEAEEAIAGDFARWVNTQLRNPLPVGDNEFVEWRKLAHEQLQALAREAA
ncbi:type I-F CRISPR-associated protein Csy1 [Ideonella paludis]|uniref:Type I-F CRISPR-associated protein Csy1 n=1 Tax=Ideonella paludis TaxID=1233411 RepID=A0ABS5E3H3_9BURK|nr:type I-F CRISPR-associated protein Csy1 [Ideonella paludis]MBQ0937894.1 type I-F CRISPR-associated protein Csy1 [Ideonella paludis]